LRRVRLQATIPLVRETCWTLIRAAAEGETAEREAFALRYLPAVEAYFHARWRGTRHLDRVDDAVQDVFLDCFREGGALDRVDRSRRGGVRAYLSGVARIVARRYEEGRGLGREAQASASEIADLPADDERLSVVFDRSWALGLLRQAAALHAGRAREQGEDAVRRVDLLRLRFEENRPIREVARMWGTDPARLHRDYARARREFKAALLEVVAFHHAGTPAEIEAEGARLLEHFA
jgi:RNA polymerase sigma factor (sigma-70 family)